MAKSPIDRPFQIVLIGLSAAAAGMLWATDIPLGVPGEWVWQRIDLTGGALRDMAAGMLIAAMAAVTYIGWVRYGATRIDRFGGAGRALWLMSLVAAGFCWLLAVQNCPPAEHRQLKPVWVLYDRGASGYFYEAVYGIDDPRQFLATYSARMSRGNVLHEGTHPPGLYLLHRALIGWCRSSPSFSQAVLATQPTGVGSSFALMERKTQLPRRLLTPEERAALWLASLLTLLVAAAAVVPVYLLVRLSWDDESGRVAWQYAALWPLVPGLAVFLPKSDALYPFVFTMFIAMWLRAMTHRSIASSIVAGGLAWIAMLLSLAVIPAFVVALLTSIITWYNAHPDSKVVRQRILVCGVIAIATFAAGTVLAFFACRINLLDVWLWNYRNHAGFYDQFPRTYTRWLVVNPLEFTMCAGVPIAMLAWRGFQQACHAAVSSRYAIRVAVAGVSVACLLWLSGKNMGEAARLWLFVVPWAIWIAAEGRSDTRAGDTNTPWGLVFCLQAAVCIATVSRVTGFQF